MVTPCSASEPQVLQRVTVRLLREGERPGFDRLLESKHYPASAQLAGQTLRSVAELDGQWVALLTFSAAAFHLKLRERWLRWAPRQCARRLLFVVNNSRFLVLPERARYPNLASRVLGLCLRRLSVDWEAQWTHPVRVVESFVDETRYRGTCYRACGFEALGPTAGFARASRGFYQEHGQPKQLYLRELRPGDRHLLRRGRLPRDLAEHEEHLTGPCPLRAGQLGSLLERFRQLHDGRRGHGLRHRQPFVLACAAVATLMGSCGYQAFEDTCKKFTQRQLKALGCQAAEHGRYAAPSDTTFFRVLNRLDPAAFAAVVGAWFLEQNPGLLARLAVDGKVLRGSGRTDGQPLQPLLRQFPALQGTLLTADALHCQRESARFITQE